MPDENIEQPGLVRKVLSEQIKERLIEEILSKKYQAGEKLGESALANRFGVSQAPVREALKSLAEMGFVTVEPYKGTTVRTMTKEDVWEAFTVRAALESLAAGIAAEKITDEELAELEQIVNEMITAAEDGDIYLRVGINNRFHEKIIEISQHKLIIQLSKSLRFASWSHSTGTFTSMTPVEIATRHKVLLKPLKEHNSEEAARVMHEHIEKSALSMLEHWNLERP